MKQSLKDLMHIEDVKFRYLNYELGIIECIIPIDTEKDKYNVFDCNKMVSLIKKHNMKNVLAGIYEDWGHTVGYVLKNNKPYHDTIIHVYSCWGTPVIMDVNTGEIYECYNVLDEVPKGDLVWNTLSLNNFHTGKSE